MRLFFIIVSLFFFATEQLSAQVVYAKADEFKSIKKRKLIVEQLEVDQALIASWQKKKGKTKKPELATRYGEMISEYKKFVADYNGHIKSAVESIWLLNEEVVYKTTSEVKALRKSKSERYSVLFFSESTTNKTDDFGHKYFPNLSIPTLNYSRIESGTVKVDYSFFMAYTGHREANELQLADVLLSLRLIQNQIAAIEKTVNNRYTFKSFASDEGKANCGTLKGATVHIDENSIHKKSTLAEINAAYSGTVKLLSNQEITTAIENEEDIIIGFFIPNTIAAGSVGSTVQISSGRITYLHVFLNVKTGEVLSCTGTSMGEFNDIWFRSGPFSKLGC